MTWLRDAYKDMIAKRSPIQAAATLGAARSGQAAVIASAAVANQKGLGLCERLASPGVSNLYQQCTRLAAQFQLHNFVLFLLQ
ncbi:hypothetical protein J6590_093925 [Homalodisca vitripennis]|nr:hypothetical protein J6590_093925 [Homalodisca vitripennis]